MIPRRRTAKPSTSPRLLLAAACAVLSACGGDSTAPPTPHVQLILTGAAAPALEHSTYPDGSWRVDCGEQITAELRGDAGASVTWDGISFFWHDASSGKLLISQSYPADSISRFLGANTLVTGATQQLNWDFWNETPFSVYVVFQYHVTGAENAGQSEEFDFRCAPVAPAPAGTFVLSSINDDPLPSYGVTAETLTLSPNLTFTLTSSSGNFGPAPFDVVSATQLSLPSAPSDAGAAGPNENWLVSGTTITHVVHQCCNNLDELWRFDLAGTHPVLPPPGALLASVDSVRFTAKSGGALPAPDTVDVSITSTGGPIPDLTLSAAATCSYGVNCATDVLNFSLNADRTPATLRLIFTSTSLPVGTYQAWIHISTDAAPNSPLIIPVTLTMTP